MREVDVVYLYEHASRELDVACAVSAILEHDYGFSVEIVQWPVGFSRIVYKLKPKKMIVFPFFYEAKEYEILLDFWDDVKYFNLAWEQLFYSGNIQAKTPRGVFALKNVYHHSWSKHYTSFLTSGGVSDSHIVVNGQPAYALYDRPYSYYFKAREDLANQYFLDPLKQWIFFPENYNWAFYSEARLGLFVKNGQTWQDVYAMKEYCEVSLSKTLHWFKEILMDNEEIELIIRPRPSVTVAEFQHVVKRILGGSSDRMHIIQEGSVREWILASDVIVSSHSTSLIEASIAGKRAYILEPIQMPVALKVDWQDLLPHIKTLKELQQFCVNGNGFVDHRLGSWARENLMGSTDAILNLAEILAKLLSASQELNSSVQVNKSKKMFIWSLYSRLHRWYLYWQTGGVEPVFVKDIVSVSEIQKRKQNWLKLLF